MRRRYLVCYDIREPGRLRRTHRTVLDFGYHLQYSVYLCDLSGAERVRLIDRLNGVIDRKADSVMIFDLGGVESSGRAQAVAQLGAAVDFPSSGPTIV